uniref:Uncharacterized protein n=1 Tax=Opuntia streptacantha TaxID=393608 RepID=A0A7C9DQR8_OPUST
MSKLGPSSKIGPRAPRTGTEKAREDDKEKLVGSLMFLKKGHRRISSFEESDSPARSLARSLKQKFMSESGIEVGKSQKPCKREMKEDVGMNQSTRENEKEFR